MLSVGYTGDEKALLCVGRESCLSADLESLFQEVALKSRSGTSEELSPS